MEDIDFEIIKAIAELEKHREIHRVKIEVEFINGVNISQETTKPNKLSNGEQ